MSPRLLFDQILLRASEVESGILTILSHKVISLLQPLLPKLGYAYQMKYNFAVRQNNKNLARICFGTPKDFDLEIFETAYYSEVELKRIKKIQDHFLLYNYLSSRAAFHKVRAEFVDVIAGEMGKKKYYFPPSTKTYTMPHHINVFSSLSRSHKLVGAAAGLVPLAIDIETFSNFEENIDMILTTFCFSDIEIKLIHDILCNYKRKMYVSHLWNIKECLVKLGFITIDQMNETLYLADIIRKDVLYYDSGDYSFGPFHIFYWINKSEGTSTAVVLQKISPNININNLELTIERLE